MERHTLAIMSGSDRRELPPVLRYSRYLYAVGTADNSYVTISDRVDGNGTKCVVRSDQCVVSSSLCAHCALKAAKDAGCRGCMLDDPGVPPSYETVADYAHRNGIRVDSHADRAVMVEFFGPGYPGLSCGEPARCLLLSMKAAQDTARELPGGEYNDIRSAFNRRLDDVIKSLNLHWVVETHEGLWTYLSIFVGRYAHGLCAARDFSKGESR